MMLILLIVLTQRSLCVWDRVSERLALLGLLCSYVIVVGIELAVHYATYYHWMNQIILVGFVCAVLERSAATLSTPRKTAIILLLGSTVLLAAPKNLFLAWCRDEDAQYRLYRKFVDDNVHANDIVFADYLGYFPLKEKNLQVYLPGYLSAMTPAQEQSVTVLLAKNINLGNVYYDRFGRTYADWFSRNGRKWKIVATTPPARSKLRLWMQRCFPAWFRGQDVKNCGYQLSLYRRADDVESNP